jgi:drug/metabolite transporter (DMT)-like permease
MIREDEELRAWMDDWRFSEPADPGAAADPAAILRQVKRRSLGLKLLTAGELLFVASVLVVLTLFTLRHPDPMDVAVMAGLSLLALGAVAFTLWNRRGLWSPAAETTAAYRALSRARARRRQEALRAARWLLLAETALFLPWIWHTLHTGPQPPRPFHYAMAYGYLALVVGAMAAGIAWLERYTRRELAALEEGSSEAAPSGLTERG